MILKRYGSTLQSVDAEFSAKALNEIGFRRNRQTSLPAAELEERFQLVTEHELTADGEGEVQSFVEQEMLDRLQARLDEVEEALADGEVLLVLNADGSRQAKTRQEIKNVVVDDENRLYFHYWVDPPLRVAVYRSTGGSAAGSASD